METSKSSTSYGNGHTPLSGNGENIDSQTAATHATVERIASGAHQAVDKLAVSATRAAQTLGIKGGQVKDAQEKMVEELRTYVRDNPIAAVGVGVAVGFLLSRLINQ